MTFASSSPAAPASQSGLYGTCAARRNLHDIPASYLDDGESLSRIFLGFRRPLLNFARESLVANFQYPCSAIRDSVRARLRPV
jgi:hypothetical protein